VLSVTGGAGGAGGGGGSGGLGGKFGARMSNARRGSALLAPALWAVVRGTLLRKHNTASRSTQRGEVETAGKLAQQRRLRLCRCVCAASPCGCCEQQLRNAI
jgi:hypothetical protein